MKKNTGDAVKAETESLVNQETPSIEGVPEITENEIPEETGDESIEEIKKDEKAPAEEKTNQSDEVLGNELSGSEVEYVHFMFWVNFKHGKSYYDKGSIVLIEKETAEIYVRNVIGEICVGN